MDVSTAAPSRVADPGGEPAAVRLRLDRTYQVALALGVGAAAVVGLIVLSTRFSISSPSLIDDWNYATYPARSIRELLHPFVYPVGPRFRPAFELWSQMEWHTLGAPRDLTGPNLWAVARVLLYVAGAVGVPALIAATSRPRPSAIGIAALAAAAGLVLFSGPWPDVDIFRLGPQEPVMVGGTVCGAALVIWGLGRVLEWRGQPRSSGQTAMVVAAFVAGLGLWGLGIYFKEASITALVMAPFLYLWLDRRWRDAGLISRPLWRQRAAQITGLVLLLPIAHVLITTATISEKGASIYGASKPSGLGGWSHRAIDALSFQWSHWNEIVGTSAWRIVAVVVLALLVVTLALRRRPVPWLAIGFVLTGWAILVVQGLPLHEESRYYIPSIALFTAAALLLLAQAPRPLLWAGVAGAVALAALNYDQARDTIDVWKAQENDDAAAVRLVAELHPASCRVYMSNIGMERAEALPRALHLTGIPLRGPCRRTAGPLIVSERGTFPIYALGPTELMGRVCAKQSILEQTDGWQIADCRKLRPRVEGWKAKQVLRPNRLVPGLGPFAVRPMCVARFGRDGCAIHPRTQ